MDKLNLKSLIEQLEGVLRTLSRYKLPIFLILIAATYGFIVMRIDTLNNAQPTPTAVAAQPNPLRSAHIDKTVVSQLQSLQDNNVNVQALFNQARNNPFQE